MFLRGSENRLRPATLESGRAAFLSLERAVADYKAGLIDVIVTAPINKNDIQSEHFHFPGHTEYFEDPRRQRRKSIDDSGKQPHADSVGYDAHAASRRSPGPHGRRSGVQAPHLPSFAARRFRHLAAPNRRYWRLNPHASDGGLLGNEEADVIAPAVKAANEAGIPCFGPYAADGFFGAGLYRRFDGVLAMYHDQGLAPFKALSMDDGINFTAGLPLVRTSPDHGTAYDIAGQGCASENSFRQAVYSAIDIWRNRKADVEAHANPLRRQSNTDRKDDEARKKTSQSAEE